MDTATVTSKELSVKFVALGRRLLLISSMISRDTKLNSSHTCPALLSKARKAHSQRAAAKPHRPRPTYPSHLLLREADLCAPVAMQNCMFMRPHVSAVMRARTRT